MIKYKYVFLIPVLLIIALGACGPATTGTIAPQTGQPSLPNATDRAFALTKSAMMTSVVETETQAGPPNSAATFTALVATDLAVSTQMAETITAMPTSIPTQAAFQYLNQIKMFDKDHGWLITGADGATRRVLHTEDGGATWNDITPKGIAFVGNGIFFLDSQTAWMPAFTAGTNIPTIFHTTDAGQSWQSYQHLPFKDATPDKPFSLHFADANNGWAFADQGVALSHYGFTLYRTLDGGVHWTQLMFAKALGLDEPSLPPGTFYVREDQGLKFLDLSTVWFGGNQLDETTRDVTLQVSHDAGKTWKTINIGVPRPTSIPNNASVAYSLPVFINPQDADLIVGYNFSSGPPTNAVQTISVLMLTQDGGSTWTPSPLLFNGTEWALHFQFVTPTDAFYQCGDMLCATHDGAQTSQPVPSNVSFGDVDGMHSLSVWDFVSVNTGWAIVYDGVLSKLINTTDGGKTWNTLQP